jgi:hypothetical protein
MIASITLKLRPKPVFFEYFELFYHRFRRQFALLSLIGQTE